MDEYSQLLHTLLKNRGIETKKDAELFLKPYYDTQNHDPFLMKDMDLAVERIFAAIKAGERIAIYGDFDADGIPASVLLHDFFKKIAYKNFSNYIPHRNEEGYGFHKHAVEKLSKEGVSLIITVDVGITNIDTVEYAQSLGVDVIVTDHHEPKKDLPNAVAVLNPKRKDDTYPFSELCGTGVAYKLVQALLYEARKKKELWVEDIKIGWEKWLLDLVAIATVADMVPLVDENRTFVRWGLFVLQRSRRLGIQALCKKLGIKQRFITEDDIGFMIAPRINAASRMGNPEEAFILLSTDDIAIAEDAARKLQKLNNQRKGFVAGIVKKLKSRFDKDTNLSLVLVAGNPDWNPALLGLAANSLVDEYKRPACFWGRDGTGVLKGSCRTDGSVSVVDMLEAAGDKLLAYGGHVGAGGFSVDNEHVHSLEKILSDAYSSVKNENLQKNENSFDVELQVSDVSFSTHRDISQLAPFGIENKKPVFLFKNVIIRTVKHFGKEKNHVEIMISSRSGQSFLAQQVRAYNFFATKDSYSKELMEGVVVDVYANLEKSLFRGSNIELRIIDVA